MGVHMGAAAGGPVQEWREGVLWEWCAWVLHGWMAKCHAWSLMFGILCEGSHQGSCTDVEAGDLGRQGGWDCCAGAAAGGWGGLLITFRETGFPQLESQVTEPQGMSLPLACHP